MRLEEKDFVLQRMAFQTVSLRNDFGFALVDYLIAFCPVWAGTLKEFRSCFR
ncbi:MAG: hypothetical protein PUG65_05100 [Firmicutes bacterium]|nr:hypothetical protein [Bacillota bacterium]